MAENKKEKKIVRASDANPIKRFAKKYGAKLVEDMTDKELEELLNKPTGMDKSVLGRLQTAGKVGMERSKRKKNLDKAYKDKILRDESKMLKKLERDKFLDKLYKEKEEKRKKQKLSRGGLSTKKYANPVTFVDNLKKKTKK
tara:strand:+ start:112 stop:537 length:426 start_codon:yes stop_codon:yes gene_type:complete